MRSSIAKFFSDDELGAIVTAAAAEPGDLLLFVADKPDVVANALGRLRVEIDPRSSSACRRCRGVSHE